MLIMEAAVRVRKQPFAAMHAPATPSFAGAVRCNAAAASEQRTTSTTTTATTPSHRDSRFAATAAPLRSTLTDGAAAPTMAWFLDLMTSALTTAFTSA